MWAWSPIIPTPGSRFRCLVELDFISDFQRNPFLRVHLSEMRFQATHTKNEYKNKISKIRNTKYWSLRAIICRQDKYQDPDWKWHTGCNAHSKPCLHTTLSTLDIAHCMSNTTHCTVCYAQCTKRMIPPKQLTSDTGKAHIEFKSFTSVVFFATFGPGCTCCV